jgi:hypothetical protein
VLVFWLVLPVSQDPDYHLFADAHSFVGAQNFWNVMSNLTFLVAGIYGLLHLAGLQFALQTLARVHRVDGCGLA